MQAEASARAAAAPNFAESIERAELPEHVKRFGLRIAEELSTYMRLGVVAPRDPVSYRMLTSRDEDAWTFEAYGDFACPHTVNWNRPRAHVSLSVESPEVGCSCPSPAGARPCDYKAYAMAELLQGLIEARGRDPLPSLSPLAELESTLRVPVWRRALDRVIGELDRAPAIPDELNSVPAWFGWRIERDRYDAFRCVPTMVRQKKTGAGVVTKPLKSFDDLGAAIEALPDRRDRELLEAWGALDALASPSYTASVADKQNQHWLALIEKLAGHARLYYHTTRSVPLRIERAAGALSFEEDEGVARLELSFGQARLAPHELEEVLGAFEGCERIVRSFEADTKSAHLIIWSLSPKALRLARLGLPLLRSPLPESAREEVLRQAPRLAARGVALGESLRGEPVAPEPAIVVRLALEEDQLSVEIRARPLQGAASVIPGTGAPVLLAARGDQIVHTERDLGGERERASSIAARIGLDEEGEADDFSYAVGKLDRAMEIAHALRDGELEEYESIVWDAGAPKLRAPIDSGALRLEVNPVGRLFALGGALEVDGANAVGLSELLRAARERRRWIELGDGSWARMTDRLRSGLERALAITNGASEAEPTLSALAAPALVQMSEESGAALSGPVAWLSLAERIEQAAALEPEVPAGFVGELRPYQRAGYAWLMRLAHWAPGACLADDMGLGKTIQVLALLLARSERGACLVIGPTSLGFNWRREAARFAPELTTHLIRSSAELDALERPPGAGDLVYMSYDLTARNDAWCGAQRWATLVLDEAQAIKNASTQRARAVRDIEADFSVLMTGTPLENHAGELWSLMAVCAPGLLGSAASFRDRFRIPIERDRDPTARAGLAALIAPFVLRRVKSEVALDLPERTDARIDVDLSRPERAAYERMRSAALNRLAEGAGADPSSRFELLAAITRLRQLACHPRLVDAGAGPRSTKVDLLIEKLEEAAESGQRALVFSQFASLLALIEDALAKTKLRVALLTGSTPAARRARLVEDFQAGAYDVFLLSIKAGGVGLNLTRATLVFHLDPWWNPAVEDQATDRVHRIGQTEPITVYRMIAVDTIEEAIYQIHESKRELLEAVLAGTGSTAPLSLEELETMIGFGAGAPAAEDFEPDTARPAPKTSLLSGRDAAQIEAAAHAYLDRLVERCELTKKTARKYRPGLTRLSQFAATRALRGPELAAAYRAAIDAGEIEAPKSDRAWAGTLANHLTAALTP